MDSSVVIIIFSLLASAYFSGTEMAFVSANKLRIELKSKQGVLSAKILSYFIKRPSTFIGTTLVGNNIALVVYGLTTARMLEEPVAGFVGSVFGPDFPLLVLTLKTILATLLVLVTAEFLPKVLFRINPDKIMSFFAPFNLILFYVLLPIAYLTVKLSEVLLKLFFGIKLTEETPVFGIVDLDHYISESTVYKEKKEDMDTEILIFKNALDFSNVKVRECMIPRIDIVAIDINDCNLDELKVKFMESGLSKILVYKETVDDIIGFVPFVELFKNPSDIKSILMDVSIVPETMLANELLSEFMEKRKSIVVVVDEHGGTSGIVTLEDVIEEIFGEINDEHDGQDLKEEEVGEMEFIFSGRHEIDYLNEKYHLGFPEDDYETLGGFIFSKHESIPEINEELYISPFKITVLSVVDNRIEEIRLKVIKEE